MIACFQSFFSALPNSVTFNVDANKIIFGIMPGKAERVFSLATTYFKQNGVVISEKMGVPYALEGEIRCRVFYPGLDNVGEGVYLGKLPELVFNHSVLIIKGLHVV